MTGMYHVRFTPDPVLFPGVAPIYYTSGTTWATADAIGLPCFLDNGNINSNTLTAQSGNGMIVGNVIIDTTFLKMMTTPMEGALVKLFNSSDQIVAFTYTDANGNYQFGGVETGSYYILLDVPYIPQLNQHAISLTGNQVVSGADFSILLDGIYADNNLQLSIMEEELATIDVYPNPAKDIVNISNSGIENYEYSITSVTGQIVMTGEVKSGINSLSTEKLSNGMYYLKIGSKDLRKIVIRK
jgi:hypothetical protein